MNNQDHDLLIEIKTKVAGLTDEVRAMRDDTKQKIKDLDTMKMPVSEFKNFQLELAKEAMRVDNELKGLREADDKMTTKIDNALRYIYIGIGMLIVVNIIVGFLK